MDRKSEPTVNFEIEIRPAGTIQKEAGKRLFKILVARAQSTLQSGKEQKNINTKT